MSIVTIIAGVIGAIVIWNIFSSIIAWLCLRNK